MKLNYATISGALIFVGSAQFLIALTVAETFYSGYSVSQNYISDLGATCRATCQIIQPSSNIFNSSVFLLGLLAMIAAVSLWRGLRYRILSVFLALTGLGAMGVGLFPETAGMTHHIVSLIAFVFAGLSAIASYRIERSPFSYFSILLGVMTLASLALFISNSFLGLGPGGMERMIVYPALIWSTSFGAHVMRISADSNPNRSR